MIGDLVSIFVAFLAGGVAATLLVAPRIGLRTAQLPPRLPVQRERGWKNEPDVLQAYVKVRNGDGDVVERLQAAALEQAYAAYGVNAQLHIEAVSQLDQVSSGGVSARVTVRQLHEGESNGS